jgi:hypothetical protein
MLAKSKRGARIDSRKQRIQLGLVIGHHIIYYARTGARDGGTRWRRQFGAVPEACGLSADWFNDL